MTARKKIIFCGTPKIGAKALEAIFDKKNYEILFTITQPDNLTNKKNEFVFSPVKSFCIKKGIKFYQPKKIIEIKDIINESKPDLILTCAYGQFVPMSILEIPKYKCVNVHASLLPKYRGGAPIHWAIINGEKETGISLMYMEKAMDSGDIIYQEKIDILDNDNLESLFERMENLTYNIVYSQIDSLFSNDLKTIKQDETKITFGYNIKREDEKINWNSSAKNIHNLIRGLDPKPGSFSMIDNKIIKIYKSEILEKKTENKIPGEVILVDKKGIIVATKDYDLLIHSIQFEGKKIINNIDIYNSRKNLENKVFK